MYTIYFAYFPSPVHLDLRLPPYPTLYSFSFKQQNYNKQETKQTRNKCSPPKQKVKKDKKALRMSKQTMKQMPYKVLFILLFY